MQNIPWLHELKPRQLEQLLSIASSRWLKAGETLFMEGEPQKELHLLLEGQVIVEVLVPGKGPVCIYTAEPLDLIGWSCITHFIRQRTASAHATLSTHLVAFNEKYLRLMCDEDHDLGYILMRRLSNVIANRLLSTRLQLYEIILNNPPDLPPK